MGAFKNETVRMLEILDKLFDDAIHAPKSVYSEYTWRYGGAKYAFEELLGQDIEYDGERHHIIM